MTELDTLIVGATGTVGQLVTSGLLEQGLPVRAATREPGRYPGTALARPVAFDLERPETFAPALAGVGRVLLMARPGDDAPERCAGPLVDAMRSAGVEHVVDLSAMGAEQQPSFGVRRVECLLEDSGLAFTHLRPNWFMQVFTAGPIAEGLRRTGVLRLPAGAAKISYVDARDVAAAAVVTLTQPGHRGAAYTLTGPEALDHAAIADALGVTYEPLDEAVARAGLVAALGERWAERVLGFYRLVRAGSCAPVSPDVPVLLGRPARSFAAFAAEVRASLIETPLWPPITQA